MKGWAGIARLGGIGDNLIAASVLRPLKRMGYMTEMITSETASSVFLNNPFIDKLSVKKDGDVPGGEDWQKWFAARANEYEVFANLSNSCETRHALHKNTTAFWWPQDYRRKLCAGSYLETVHDIVGVAHEFGPLYFPTEEEMDTARRTVREKIGDRRYLAWVISGSRIDKLYPYAAHAISRIIKELDIPVLLLGAGDHQRKHADVVATEVKRTNSDRDMLMISVPHEDMDQSMRTGIRPTLAAAMASSIVVTPDTGVAWAVAMEPMLKIVMVSHASVENITKHWANTTTLHADSNNVPCWPCHRLHDDPSTCTPSKDGGNSAACMADISVETVVQNVKRLWRKEPSNVVRLEAAE